MSYRNAVISNIWKNCVCRCDQKDLHRRKSYFTGLVSSQDANLRNTGKFFLATAGGSAITTAGYVEVDYTVEFETPQKHIAPSLIASATGPGAFGNEITVTTKGGMANLLSRVSATAANINQAGQYLMSVHSYGGSNPDLGVLTSPSGNVTITELARVLNSTAEFAQYFLNVKVPHATDTTPVDLQFNSGTGLTTAAITRMAPYSFNV
jgi:hypothetical protein